MIQVAAGRYDAVKINGASDLRLIGGFPSGDFSRRDPADNETILRGTRADAVVAVFESRGVHIEGFHLTGGGGFDNGYRVAGGGVFVDETSSDASIVANRIVNNAVDRGTSPESSLGGGIGAFGGGKTTIVGNVVEGNRAGRGGAIAAGGEVIVDRNTVRNNVGVGDHGGGIYLTGNVVVTRNRVEGNRITLDYGWGGGILVYNDEGKATLRGNVVTGNSAPSAGSGVFIDDGADATLVGELYYANGCAVQGGAGLYADSGGKSPTEVRVINATIADHDCPNAALGGNGILAEVSDTSAGTIVSVTNSIMWGNAGKDVFSVGARLTVTYSISGQRVEGTGNLSNDPLFAAPDAGDFRVRDGSPAIDVGDPASDYSAEPAPNGGRIDLGHTGGTPEASRSS